MSSLNKYQKILIFFIAIIVIGGIYYYLDSKNLINLNLFKKKDDLVYSVDPKDLNNTKTKLIPADFPLPKDVSESEEFQRSMNSLLEYTNTWVSKDSHLINEGLYIKYMNDNGWKPFVTKVADDMISISGERDGLVVNIFVQDLGDSTSKVQIHFSQSKNF